MTTFRDISARILRVLADTDGTQYDTDLLLDGVRAALEELLHWVPKQAVTTVVGDGTSTAFVLPSDLYQVVSVWDSESGRFIPQATMSAGQYPGGNLESNQDWTEYPEGSLSLANALEDGETLVVYYNAKWVSPSSANDDIETPSWLHRAIVFYAASYALLKRATAGANVGQFDLKTVDSGTPPMNPMKDMSTYFYDRFLQAMKTVPGRRKGVHG